jgi:hypothetical protein
MREQDSSGKYSVYTAQLRAAQGAWPSRRPFSSHTLQPSHDWIEAYSHPELGIPGALRSGFLSTPHTAGARTEGAP